VSGRTEARVPAATAPDGRGPSWRAVVAGEVDKVTTTRVVSGLLLAQAGLVALAVTGVVLASGVSEADLASDIGVRRVLEHGGLATVLSLVIGVMAVAGEYRHATITDTYLSEPRRGRVLAAKSIVGAGIGTLAGLVSAVVALVATTTWMSVRDVAFDPWSETVVRSLTGLVAWNVCYAVIGVALGALVRNVTGAIVLVLLWTAVVEGAIAALAPDVGRWLPATAAVGLGYGSADSLLPQAGAGLVLLAYTAVLAAAAVVLTRRRDVV
jgi:ABC-2 type transport system permease protein